MEHPLIRSLGEAANDLVTWSNVCHSILTPVDDINRNTFSSCFTRSLLAPALCFF